MEDLAACVDDLAGTFLPQAFSRIERVLQTAKSSSKANLGHIAPAARRMSVPEPASPTHTEQVLALAAQRRRGPKDHVAGIL